MKQYNVYGVGNALVDFQARVSDETLLKLDFPKGIMTLVDEATQQRVLGHIDHASVTRCAGGSWRTRSSGSPARRQRGIRRQSRERQHR